MADDIICPECGRPNLAEAERCWYCQKPFNKGVEAPEDEPLPENATVEEDDHIGLINKIASEPEEIDSEIPDWLKRIRELKQAEQEQQEEDDLWRQEKLFGSLGDESRQKTRRKTETRLSAGKMDEIKKSPPKTNTPPNLEMIAYDEKKASLAPTEDDMEPETPSDGGQGELPNGFTPLDTKKG